MQRPLLLRRPSNRLRAPFIWATIKSPSSFSYSGDHQASFAWATSCIGVGLTPTSSFAKCSRSRLTSLAQPLGESHCFTIKPSIQSELLSSTLFRRPRRRVETTWRMSGARRSCLTPKLVRFPYLSRVYLVSPWIHLSPW